MADPHAPPAPAGPAGSAVPAVPADLESVKRLVATRFRVYDARAEAGAYALYVLVPEGGLEAAFQATKRDLRALGLVPFLRYEGGEHIVFVVREDRRSAAPDRLNVFLFAMTVVTTVFAGILAYYPYAHPESIDGPAPALDELFAPRNWLMGFLLFALPLLAILLVHESAHYVMARRHGVRASLPFFIPLPPLFAVNVGTMGAFISMREPIPSRKALLDIGASGPIAGLIVALPILVAGLAFMEADPVVVKGTIVGLQDADAADGITVEEGAPRFGANGLRFVPNGSAEGGFDVVELEGGPNGTFVFVTIVDGNETRLDLAADDVAVAVVGLPFAFPFAGRVFDSAHVSEDGFLAFVPPADAGCCLTRELPSPDAPAAMLAAFWRNLDPGKNGTVAHAVVNGTFVVEWHGVPDPQNRTKATFQVVLHENGTIEYLYERARTPRGLSFLGTPLLYDALAERFRIDDDAIIHPLAFAGWVGLLVTGLNLLPAGQLDGGHVAAALFGERAKALSYACVVALIVLGYGLPAMGPFPGFEGYGGWLLLALIVAFLGTQHPPTLDDVTGIDMHRALVGGLALLVLVVTFIPVPLRFA